MWVSANSVYTSNTGVSRSCFGAVVGDAFARQEGGRAQVQVGTPSSSQSWPLAELLSLAWICLEPSTSLHTGETWASCSPTCLFPNHNCFEVIFLGIPLLSAFKSSHCHLWCYYYLNLQILPSHLCPGLNCCLSAHSEIEVIESSRTSSNLIPSGRLFEVMSAVYWLRLLDKSVDFCGNW